MKKYLLLFSVLMSAFSLVAQSRRPLQFPEDFVLPAAQTPSGFRLAPVTDEEREAGIIRNPGLVGVAFFRDIYDGLDVDAVDKVYTGFYQQLNNKEREIGYYVFAYSSVEARETEQEKIKKNTGDRYLVKDRYLLMVWSDAGSAEIEVNKVADYYQQKLQLEDLAAPGQESNTAETTDAAAE